MAKTADRLEQRGLPDGFSMRKLADLGNSQQQVAPRVEKPRNGNHTSTESGVPEIIRRAIGAPALDKLRPSDFIHWRDYSDKNIYDRAATVVEVTEGKYAGRLRDGFGGLIPEINAPNDEFQKMIEARSATYKDKLHTIRIKNGVIRNGLGWIMGFESEEIKKQYYAHAAEAKREKRRVREALRTDQENVPSKPRRTRRVGVVSTRFDYEPRAFRVDTKDEPSLSVRPLALAAAPVREALPPGRKNGVVERVIPLSPPAVARPALSPASERRPLSSAPERFALPPAPEVTIWQAPPKPDIEARPQPVVTEVKKSSYWKSKLGGLFVVSALLFGKDTPIHPTINQQEGSKGGQAVSAPVEDPSRAVTPTALRALEEAVEKAKIAATTIPAPTFTPRPEPTNTARVETPTVVPPSPTVPRPTAIPTAEAKPQRSAYIELSPAQADAIVNAFFAEPLVIKSGGTFEEAITLNVGTQQEKLFEEKLIERYGRFLAVQINRSAIKNGTQEEIRAVLNTYTERPIRFTPTEDIKRELATVLTTR